MAGTCRGQQEGESQPLACTSSRIPGKGQRWVSTHGWELCRTTWLEDRPRIQTLEGWGRVPKSLAGGSTDSCAPEHQAQRPPAGTVPVSRVGADSHRHHQVWEDSLVPKRGTDRGRDKGEQECVEDWRPAREEKKPVQRKYDSFCWTVIDSAHVKQEQALWGGAEAGGEERVLRGPPPTGGLR